MCENTWVYIQTNRNWIVCTHILRLAEDVKLSAYWEATQHFSYYLINYFYFSSQDREVSASTVGWLSCLHFRLYLSFIVLLFISFHMPLRTMSFKLGGVGTIMHWLVTNFINPGHYCITQHFFQKSCSIWKDHNSWKVNHSSDVFLVRNIPLT